MRIEAKRWIEQGKADLNSSENSLKSKDFYVSVFLSQQAIEKILKGIYI